MYSSLKKMLALLMLGGAATGVSAQEIAADSKSNSVFTYFKPESVWIDLSSDFAVTFGIFPQRINYVPRTDTLKKVPKVINLRKSTSYFLQLGVLNAGKLIALNKLDEFSPGIQASFGYQMSVDSISPKYGGPTYSWGIRAFGSVDNFKLYDPLKALVSRVHPNAFGLEANYTWFFPTKGQKTHVLAAFTASYTKGSNSEDLLGFRDARTAVVTSEALAFDKFDGRYGTLDNKVHKWRLTAALPISFWYLNPIPYAGFVKTGGGGESYIFGIYQNILGERLNFKVMKMPTTFGIGADVIHEKGKWDGGNVFLRGSVSFGDTGN